LALSTLIAFPAGIWAAARRGRVGDVAVMGATQLGVAVPNFWFAMLMVLVFAIKLRWFPAGGFAGWEKGLLPGLKSLTLPAIALALPQAAILTRVMRSALIDALGEDYIRTARAKGLTRGQALRRHALRNALIPVLTIIGMQFSFLLAGAIIIENVFFLPGLGRLVFQSISGGHADVDIQSTEIELQGTYRGATGLDPAFIAELEKKFGFDKPMHERFIDMIGNFIVFDFGTSFFRDETVIDLVLEKMPVSISLGLWTTLIVYLVCIPLGIRKAVNDGTRFDVWTTTMLTIGFAIPSFVMAILLIVLFAGGSFLDIFPLRGLVSEDFEELSLGGQILDYLWHLVLPITALVLGGFLSLTMLTKNSYLDQINMLYVQTARAKGLSEKRVMYGHVFRNAMLIVIAGFPGAFVGILFTGAMLIEIIFSLDGLGLLGFEAAIKRDYPIMFATVYFFTLLGLVMNLIGDLMYTIIDPRIDFEGRHV
ncbi:MAG: microcin C ABC transporter permease YejB, partial [Alphaproteobacteria bacterium]|nr:microcin C ABC transporter permease YejB [Alphaproteobacteria bacterium]